MKEAVKWLYSIFPLPIIAIGTLGNILCIIVCRRKVVKEHAFSICLIVLAASDTVSMHSGLWRWWVKAAFDYDIRRSDLSCKMLLFLLWFSGDNSSWILCLITMQRFVSVWIPTKAKWLCNHKASIIGCASMALLTFAKNLHLLVADRSSHSIVRYAFVYIMRLTGHTHDRESPIQNFSTAPKKMGAHISSPVWPPKPTEFVSYLGNLRCDAFTALKSVQSVRNESFLAGSDNFTVSVPPLNLRHD